MEFKDLIKALEKMKVETGSLVCLGCGHEHSCSVHGCFILREAIRTLERMPIAANYDYIQVMSSDYLKIVEKLESWANSDTCDNCIAMDDIAFLAADAIRELIKCIINLLKKTEGWNEQDKAAIVAHNGTSDKMLNPAGEYAVKFAENHKISIAEAMEQPMVKARFDVFNAIGK